MPAEPRFVVVVAPHTSNWDFPVGVAAMLALGLGVHWLGKDTLFRWPLSPLLRWLGGEPVDRAAPGGVVGAAVARMRAEPRYVIALAPEGTRRRVESWRTGFHHVARGAGVPVVPAWLDWGRRAVGIGAPVWLGDDLEADVARIRALYRKEMARYPAKFAESDGAGG